MAASSSGARESAHRESGLHLWTTGESGRIPLAYAGDILASGVRLTNRSESPLKNVRLTVHMAEQEIFRVWVSGSPRETASPEKLSGRRSLTWTLSSLAPRGFIAVNLLAHVLIRNGRICGSYAMAHAAGYKPIRVRLPCLTIVPDSP